MERLLNDRKRWQSLELYKGILFVLLFADITTTGIFLGMWLGVGGRFGNQGVIETVGAFMTVVLRGIDVFIIIGSLWIDAEMTREVVKPILERTRVHIDLGDVNEVVDCHKVLGERVVAKMQRNPFLAHHRKVISAQILGAVKEWEAHVAMLVCRAEVEAASKITVGSIQGLEFLFDLAIKQLDCMKVFGMDIAPTHDVLIQCLSKLHGKEYTIRGTIKGALSSSATLEQAGSTMEAYHVVREVKEKVKNAGLQDLFQKLDARCTRLKGIAEAEVSREVQAVRDTMPDLVRRRDYATMMERIAHVRGIVDDEHLDGILATIEVLEREGRLVKETWKLFSRVEIIAIEQLGTKLCATPDEVQALLARFAGSLGITIENGCVIAREPSLDSLIRFLDDQLAECIRPRK